jgi:pyruvate dehydrogenase E2 component (dihydrolipoamide acetyltransferase)
VRDAPAVVDGAIVAQKQLTLTATIDHRFMDGAQGATLAKTVRRLMGNPWLMDGRDGPPATLEAPESSS